MSSHTRSAATWDHRIARARELAQEQAPAREALTFYAAIAQFQQTLFLAAPPVRDAVGFARAVDVAAASAAVPDFLLCLERNAPKPLAGMAARFGGEVTDWEGLMREYLASEDPGVASRDEERSLVEARDFVVEAVVQPYAEAAAIDARDRAVRPSNHAEPRASRCPVCAGLPVVGILREEGQGARRMLVCGRCLTEWEYVRVVCPACFEEGFDSLPVYTAEALPHVRIEACDACRRYLKTIDLTKNGLAVPLVDDVASLPLDLWARDQGYRRLRANLLRTDATGAMKI